MSTVNLTLGGKQKIATVTVKDTNGTVIPKSELQPLVYSADTPGIVGESNTTYGDGQCAALAVGSTNVQWTAQRTAASGGGVAVPSAPDTLVVTTAPIGSVTVAWTDSPV